MAELQMLDRGNRADYVLGTDLGWKAFDVVRWHAVEGISRPFEHDIILARSAEAGPVEIHELVDTGATFRVATEARWRNIHGIVAEAELLEATPTLLLYRVLLVPHLWRACHRRRCRTFVDQSLAQVVAAVLENRAPKHPAGQRGLALLTAPPAAGTTSPSFDSFVPPGASYRWALTDPSRIERSRPFVVQYNELDLDFLSRLLEAEGVSYFFEHGAAECVVTLTDRPGQAPLFPTDEVHALVGTMQAGATRDQEVVRAWRPIRRLRSAAVTMRDYAWRKSLTLLEASTRAGSSADDDLEHYEFPACDEDDPTAPGEVPARIQLERYGAERALGQGASTVRTHEPGYRFRLQDRAMQRPEEDLLLVAVESYATQLAPEGTLLDGEPFGFDGAAPATERGAFFESRFHALPADVRYRPARQTSRPRIDGVQTARVTAEELAPDSPPPELNSDAFSRVRVRFPWDQRPNDGTPSSKWVRVSQAWAGAGFGALHVPRVGHEVLVAFERGDPDRPIVVGRLYNEQCPPPYRTPNLTLSTVKSDSVGEDGSSADGFNELRFEDAASREQVFLHAQRNLDEVVRACHTTSVGGDQSNSVGGDQSNSVQGNRAHSVEGTENVDVTGNRETLFHANEQHAVSGSRNTIVGHMDKLRTSQRATFVVESDLLDVDGLRTVHVKADHVVTTDANYQSIAAANHLFSSANMLIRQGAEFHVSATTLSLNVGGASLRMQAGLIALDNGAGASIVLAGGLVAVTSGQVVSSSLTHLLKSAGATTLSCGGDLNAKAATIKLNE